MKKTNTIDLNNFGVNEKTEIKTNKSEVGVINMSVQGNNALKIEKKNEDKKSGFQFKINKFDIYFGITKNEEREIELNEKKIKSYQNLKAVQADREKMAVKFLGDL
ncbi:MAG: hypothetical protein WBA54_02285 [Acidaminobacteraceae bacterium]